MNLWKVHLMKLIRNTLNSEEWIILHYCWEVSKFPSSAKKEPCFVMDVTVQNKSLGKWAFFYRNQDFCNWTCFFWTDKNASKLKACPKAFSSLCIFFLWQCKSCLITGVFWWKGQIITNLYFSLTSNLLGAYD